MNSGEYHNTHYHDFGLSGDEYYSTRRRRSPFWLAFWTSLTVSIVSITVFHLLILPWWQKASAKVVVPQLSGLKIAQAAPLLASLGLQMERMARQADEKPAGTVLSHVPTPGSRVYHGTVIRLILSLGPSTKAPRETTTTSTASSPASPGTTGVGTVASTSAGVTPPVRLSPSPVSSDAMVKVPRMTDTSLAEAKRRIKHAGLRLRHISFGSDEDKSPHWVLQQSPRASTLVPKGSPVDLTINRDDL